MTASRSLIPFQGYHRYIASAASMRVKIAALISVVNAAGATMTQAETVTLFNDMCVMAPHTLADAAITWRTVNAPLPRRRSPTLDTPFWRFLNSTKRENW